MATTHPPFPGFDLAFEERAGYLLAQVSGPADSLEISISYWQAVAAEAARRGTTHLLVWENFPNDVGALEAVHLGAFLAELGFHHIRIAFVDAHLEHLDRNRFVEVIATSTGVTGRVFAHFEEAERWLLAG